MPDPTDQTFHLAVQHHNAGRLQQAERLYRQVLAEHPDHADAIHLMGVIAHQAGRDGIAVDLIGRAIALAPDHAEAYSNLGVALKSRGQLDEAIAAYRQAIALRADYAEAYSNLGLALKERGQFEDAIAALRRAIVLKPDFPDAHNNLGTALKSLGHLDEAIEAFKRTIALRPTYAEAFSNLGISLRDKGQLDEAIAACRRAITLRPNYAEGHSNLGLVLKDHGELDEAIVACRRAIALKPRMSGALNNLGTALKDAGDLDAAIEAFRQAMNARPDFVKAHSNLVYTLNFHPQFEATAIADERRRWNDQHAAPLRRFQAAWKAVGADRSADHRLRIGYVSPDFRDHVVGRNLLPLFRHHDRREFEVFCYSEAAHGDAITAEFQNLADGWRETVGLSDEQAANRIREDRIDILVDLALHMAGNRVLIFARKPAPVQATFAGYPGSTGMNAIDYRLSDPHLDPPGIDESVYSERTIRLPETFWCYDPLENRDIAVNPPPASKTGVVTFGCLNNFCKINGDVLFLWAKVMARLENSRLLLLAPPGSHRQRTIDRLHRAGIDPHRIEFASPRPRRNYLELYHRIDVGLDSFPYNGHTTSLDSFWMGVPVVTLVGPSAVSRAGWSQLSNLGLQELAAHSHEEFVDVAVALGSDLPRLTELRATLRERMEKSPLMNGPKFARDIESAYREMWLAWEESTGGE